MKQIFIAFDQFINTLLVFLPGGCWADETLSSRCWRMRLNQPFLWLRPIIDTLLWFDPLHCRTSYEAERDRLQCPPEMRFTIQEYIYKGIHNGLC